MKDVINTFKEAMYKGDDSVIFSKNLKCYLNEIGVQYTCRVAYTGIEKCVVKLNVKNCEIIRKYLNETEEK